MKSTVTFVLDYSSAILYWLPVSSYRKNHQILKYPAHLGNLNLKLQDSLHLRLSSLLVGPQHDSQIHHETQQGRAVLPTEREMMTRRSEVKNIQQFLLWDCVKVWNTNIDT